MPKLGVAGAKETERAIQQALELASKDAPAMVQRCLLAIREEIAPYPPQPRRDRAPSGKLNTYVRGIGRFPRSAFVGGKLSKRGAKLARERGRVRYTSQRMNTRWQTRVAPTGKNAVVGELWNNATYSGWVVGPSDRTKLPHQTSFHKETGWISADEAVRRAASKIDAIVESYADQVVRKLAEL